MFKCWANVEASYQVVVVGELELVVAGQLVGVASVFVLLVSIEAIPVVFLNGRGAFVNEVAGSFEAFKRSSPSSS